MGDKKKIAVFISGRGSNMEAVLRNCKETELGNLCEPLLVLSNNPEAAGLAVAEHYGVETAVVMSRGKGREIFETEILSLLLARQIDYIILAGFNRIISPFLIQHFSHRIINIHPADTRAYQGLHGYTWAYEQQLTETKITVHYVDEGVDTGEIILQGTVDLTGVQNLEDVTARGLRVEHEIYSKALIKVFSESK